MKNNEMKHVVFGIGILGINRAREMKQSMVTMAWIARERWYKNIKTKKVVYKPDGFVLVPINQVRSKNIEDVRKKIHKEIDVCIDKYIEVNECN